MSEQTVPFTQEAVKSYLDVSIDYWRTQKTIPVLNRPPGRSDELIECYIDAFQSIRASIFGETKP